jgi:Ca-activated chloride channel family protein
MSALEPFHFLRPLWLLALPAAGLLLWLSVRERSVQRAWRGLIAPHLLESLTLAGGATDHRVRPVHLLAAFWVLGTIAVAGPAWQREASPFAEDRAALVIALAVTPTMLAQDVQPSRLERAVQKIHDLQGRRPGGRTALVAYAGSAHLVVPLTRDSRIIEMFAGELSPDIMPSEGNSAAAAVRLANAQLANADLPGSILLVTDEVPAEQWEELRGMRTRGGADVLVYALAAGPEVTPPSGSPPAPALDGDAMKEAGRAGGGGLLVVSVDDRDVDELAARVERSVSRAAESEGDRWRDAGYALLPVIALIVLFWFRRGFKLEDL